MAGHRKRPGYVRERVAVPNCSYCGLPGSPHAGCLKRTAKGLFDQELRRELSEYATPIDISPEQALLALVRESAGNVAWLGARLQQLVEDSPRRGQTTDIVVVGTPARTTGLAQAGGYDQGDLLFGPKVEIDRNGVEHIVGEEYRAMVFLYNEERDRLRLCAKDAISAGILKSQVDIAEHQAGEIVGIFNRMLDRMDLDEAKQLVARQLVAEEFRELAKEAGVRP